jgi:hypothetical protein
MSEKSKEENAVGDEPPSDRKRDPLTPTAELPPEAGALRGILEQLHGFLDVRVRDKSKEEIAVGDERSSDWKLDPLTHAARLPPEAGVLRRILEQPDVLAVMTRFNEADKKADSARRRYKRAAYLRLYAGVTATIIGAVFFLPLETWIGGTARSIPAALQYGCLFIAFMAALWLARATPFDAWMTARAEAEIARINIFYRIIDGIETPGPGELPLLPLQLEYFRRYQLDVQRRYYAGRGQAHARAAGWTRRWQMLSLGLSGLAAAVAVIAGLEVVIDFGIPLPDWIKAINGAVQPHLPDWINKAVLALGVIASALFGASVSRSFMNLDERNASRYLTTAANLDYIAGEDLQEARTQAAEGLTEPVHAFVKRIQDMLSTEHQEWVLLSQTRPSPIKGSVRPG